VGQLSEVTEPHAIADPSVCSDDFFHHDAALDGSLQGSPGLNAFMSPGIYVVTENRCETMTAFLGCVAFCRNVTEPNVESWVTAVEAKLANIGITTPQMAVAKIHSINPKLASTGHILIFIQTLGLIA
jgi:hypothetical protein